MAAEAGVEPLVCDVTDAGDRARLVEAAGECRHLVNVASGAGKTGSTHEAAVYGASKATVLSLTRSCAPAYAGRA